MVPSMILQPLVENAIRHGVEKMTDPGRIEIEAILDGDALVLRVSDNGPGESATPDLESGGVGLSNTRARLEQLYGASGAFSLSRNAGGSHRGRGASAGNARSRGAARGGIRIDE